MRREPVVTICASSRFYGTAKTVAAELRALGLQVRTPDFDYDETRRVVEDPEKHRLTREFLEKIRTSTHIYVVAGAGYTGTSVCIEVGFASALGISVVLSEEPGEAAIRALTAAVVPVDAVRGYFESEALDT